MRWAPHLNVLVDQYVRRTIGITDGEVMPTVSPLSIIARLCHVKPEYSGLPSISGMGISQIGAATYPSRTASPL